MKSFLQKLAFIVFAVSLISAFSVAQAKDMPFSDVPENHPYYEAMLKLSADGTIRGYPDGMFRPERTVNRAEFLKIVLHATGFDPTSPDFDATLDCFSDIGDQWFKDYVCHAKEEGFVKGYSDGTFQPNQNINLVEASAILGKILEAKGLTLPVKNLGNPYPWFKPYVLALEEKKMIPVTIDTIDEKVTRSEAVEMVARFFVGETLPEGDLTKTYVDLGSDFPRINSCEELKAKFSFAKLIRSREYTLERTSISQSLQVQPLFTADATAEESGALAPAQGGAADYSTTNVQVEGVDEADVVKNDGEYIYLVKGRSLRIIKAHPPENLAEISKITFAEINFNPKEMYLSEGKLAVIGSSFIEDPVESAPGSETIGVSPTFGRPGTTIYIFDVSDRAAPRQERRVLFDGDYVSSRKIDDRVYIVTNDAGYYRILGEEPTPDTLLPKYFDSKAGRELPMTLCSKIHFNPRYTDLNYLIVASVSLSSNEERVTREVFMGMGGTVYASRENLYVAAPHYGYNEQVRYDIWAPPIVNENTVIYKFELLGERGANFSGQGEVPGRILNQFSMDEHEGAFRIATTKGQVWNTREKSTNNLYMLDVNDLKNVFGKVEGLAPGETIYSVRFLGDRAYLVTFKKIDPFFVIDVSDPRNPQVLGSLKIPGYSDYLHPFDENHIIGFGKEAVDPLESEELILNNNDFSFAWYQGMKIALFDVSDVANPKLLFNEVIGDRGTESEVLNNHKALLYDKTRNLFAFPVLVAQIPDVFKTGYTGSEYGTPVFQGAYVYTLDLENGFQLKGRVTHFPPVTANTYNSFWDPENTISRIIYIGDHLYTISLGKVKAINRETMEEVNMTTLEPLPQGYYPIGIE